MRGGQWNVKWSSDWSDSPNAVMSSNLDNSYTFSGPTETKIHYAYNFYFGVPGKDSGGWCCVERGEWLGVYEYDSYIDKPSTWKDLKSNFEYKNFIPEDKVEDYWWYSSNSATSIEEHYAYKLSDSLELPLNNYNFYLVLKDKPNIVTEDLPANGTFVTVAGGGHTLKMDGANFNYDGTEYFCIKIKLWQPSKTNNGYAVLLTDGTSDYTAYLIHYYNPSTGAPYFNLRPPKSYEGDDLPDDANWDIMPPAKTLIRNFAEQQ